MLESDSDFNRLKSWCISPLICQHSTIWQPWKSNTLLLAFDYHALQFFHRIEKKKEKKKVAKSQNLAAILEIGDTHMVTNSDFLAATDSFLLLLVWTN